MKLNKKFMAVISAAIVTATMVTALTVPAFASSGIEGIPDHAPLIFGHPDHPNHVTTTGTYKPATETEDGYTCGWYCYDCGHWLFGHDKIEARGSQQTANSQN